MPSTKLSKRASRSAHKLLVGVKAHPYLTATIVGAVVLVTAGIVYVVMEPNSLDHWVNSISADVGAVMVFSPHAQPVIPAPQPSGGEQTFVLNGAIWTLPDILAPNQNKWHVHSPQYYDNHPGSLKLRVSESSASLIIGWIPNAISVNFDWAKPESEKFFPNISPRILPLVTSQQAAPGVEGQDTTVTCDGVTLSSVYEVDLTDQTVSAFSVALNTRFDLYPSAESALDGSTLEIQQVDGGACTVTLTGGLKALILWGTQQNVITLNKMEPM